MRTIKRRLAALESGRSGGLVRSFWPAGPGLFTECARWDGVTFSHYFDRMQLWTTDDLNALARTGAELDIMTEEQKREIHETARAAFACARA